MSGFFSREGIFKNVSEPARKKLGYPIKKRKDAFLITLSFGLNPEKLKELEKKLKFDNQILRHTILEKIPAKIPEKIKRPLFAKSIEKKSTFAESEKKTPELKKPAPAKKVELKEIDKKIEEILNE